MNRVDAIQRVIDRKKARIYLEIGFGHGDCFFNIKAPRKIVVDPVFTFPKKRTIKQYFRSLAGNIRNRYYSMTSDDFFKYDPERLFTAGLDVAFLDGLHTYRQALRDVTNTLRVLKDDGIIVIHDCNPRSAAEACPADSYREARDAKPAGWNGFWSGDVWKTIVYLRSVRSDLGVVVLDFDMGIGIITRKPGSGGRALNYQPEEIGNLDYENLEKDRVNMLNLKDAAYLDNVLNEIN